MVSIMMKKEESRFAVAGVKNAAKLQHDLASMCSEMEPPLRAHIQIHGLHGKHVVTAGVPEIPLQQKPYYYPSAGLTNGGFIRVADEDRKLSSYEVQMMLSARVQPPRRAGCAYRDCRFATALSKRIFSSFEQ